MASRKLPYDRLDEPLSINRQNTSKPGRGASNPKVLPSISIFCEGDFVC